MLEQIADGVTIYELFRRDAEAMGEFQHTRHWLREMERLGLLGRLFVGMRASRSEEYVDLGMV